MYDEPNHDQQALRGALAAARERLDDLVGELRNVDAELEGMAAERRQHSVLQELCRGLEELGELGGVGLFWEGRATPVEGENHVRRLQGRVDAFRKGLSEIEGRRQALIDEIDREQENTDLLEDDIFEAVRRAEERKLEWVVERELYELPFRASSMPWSRGGDDDQRFRSSLAASLLIALLLGLLLPMIELPLPEPWQAIEVPDRLTRLIREERPLTVPEETEPTEELVAEEPAPEQSDKVRATESAEPKGILAFREKFSGLAENQPAAKLGAQARIRNEGGAARGRAGRSMVATQAAGSSGGINLAELSRDVGGGGSGGIQRVEVARATSSIGAGGGTDRPLSDGPRLSRTDEEIQIVFDRHKAVLYRLYNRELRRDPTLQGQMVLRIRIEPNGSVSLCRLQSTDMNASELAAQVVARVAAFDFGAKDGIPPVTILYPIDFLPAT